MTYIAPEVRVISDPQLVGGVRHDVLAACREALANISRHTFATSVIVIVERREAVVELIVSHSGGLRNAADSLADESGGRGIDNLRQRAAAHGGDVGLTVTDGSSELRFTVVAPID